ncbi:MAG: hypothetical protein ACI32C_06240 [Candidatus Enteromonas sp.]
MKEIYGEILKPNGSKEKYEYGSAGELVQIFYSKSSESISNQHEYDDKENLSKVTTEGGSVYEFTYDTNQRVTKVTLSSQALASTEYGAAKNGVSLDMPTRQQLGNTLANGYYDFLCDSKQRLTQIKFNGVLQAEYTYNESDQISCVHDVIN